MSARVLGVGDVVVAVGVVDAVVVGVVDVVDAVVEDVFDAVVVAAELSASAVLL